MRVNDFATLLASIEGLSDEERRFVSPTGLVAKLDYPISYVARI
jgi:hypothetical protein